MRLLKRLFAASGFVTDRMTRGPKPRIVADAQKSADWIANALLSEGYEVDFSLESLKEIDRFFDDHAPDGAIKPNGLLSRDLGARVFGIGSYAGEVLRREFGGDWQGDDDDPQAEINLTLKLPDGALLWPVQRVMKRCQVGREESVFVYGSLATQADPSFKRKPHHDG
jgi:hypothetical protein